MLVSWRVAFAVSSVNHEGFLLFVNSMNSKREIPCLPRSSRYDSGEDGWGLQPLKAEPQDVSFWGSNNYSIGIWMSRVQ